MEKINRKMNEASNPVLLQDSSVNISNSSSNKTTINSFTSSRNKSKRNSNTVIKLVIKHLIIKKN